MKQSFDITVNLRQVICGLGVGSGAAVAADRGGTTKGRAISEPLDGPTPPPAKAIA